MTHSSSAQEHKHSADKKKSLSIALITVSDTRTKETDQNFQFFSEEIDSKLYSLNEYCIIKDEKSEIEEVLERFSSGVVNVLIFNGGTGISRRDTTYDVLSKKFDKTIDGFGELFRFLSYQEIGSPAMLSRASAGIYKNTVVFSLPGSPHAVKLAWNKLIKPELNHLIYELKK